MEGQDDAWRMDASFAMMAVTVAASSVAAWQQETVFAFASLAASL